jgi:hypothetical protein
MNDRCHPYLDRGHAASLAAGSGAERVLAVAAWDGAPLLLRRLPQGPGLDAAGCYPMLPFSPRWDVGEGAAELTRAGLVSAVFVSDPALPPPDAEAFDHAMPFKTHHLVQAGGGGYVPSGHHAQEIRRAARRCVVEEVEFAAHLDTWCGLYRALAEEKGFAGGVQDFAPGHFAALARLGVRAWLARVAHAPVAMALWLRHGDVGYYHLAASSPQGRRASAAFLLVDAAIRSLLADGVATIVLGGAAGAHDSTASGLARFKAGFANASAVNLVCGLVLDRARYRALAASAAQSDPAWFPAYRAPYLAPLTGQTPARVIHAPT